MRMCKAGIIAMLGSSFTGARATPTTALRERDFTNNFIKQDPPQLNPKVKDNRPWWQDKRW